jgi:hypothetical protein
MFYTITFGCPSVPGLLTLAYSLSLLLAAFLLSQLRAHHTHTHIIHTHTRLGLDGAPLYLRSAQVSLGLVAVLFHSDLSLRASQSTISLSGSRDGIFARGACFIRLF